MCFYRLCPKQFQEVHEHSLFQSDFNPSTPSPINTSGISKSPQEKISFSLIEPKLRPCTPACGYKFHALAVYLHSTLTAHSIRGTFGIQSNICGGALLRKSQRTKAVGYFRRRALSSIFDRILNETLPNNSLHLHQKFATFPGMFGEIPRNV